MPLVQLRVSDNQLDRWDEHHAESVKYDDRSDLIRTAVERAIADDKQKESEGDDGVGAERLGEVLEELERLEGISRDIERGVQNARTDILTEAQIADIVENSSYEAISDVIEEYKVVETVEAEDAGDER